jgi:hypothetical protein
MANLVVQEMSFAGLAALRLLLRGLLSWVMRGRQAG